MKTLLTLGLILLFGAAAPAQTRGERIQRLVIRDGIRSGQLSRPEIRELRKNQVRYDLLQRRVHRDGRVTPLERKRLHRAKAQNRRELIRFKHNRQRRVI